MGKLKRDRYEDLLEPMERELVAMARWVVTAGARVVVLFEGRDTAGKGGVIKTISRYLNPRMCRIVALGKPDERERGQWYFQRYVEHLPTAGEIVLFDRSWYNRAGVEKVMGFASDEQVQSFLSQAPQFERQLTDDGVILLKYWLACDQEKQEERFEERLNDPLKRWKLSPMDLAAREKYREYTRAREAMLAATHTPHAPWTIVDFNDQKRGRLTLVRDLLDRLPHEYVEPAVIEMDKLGAKPAREEFDIVEPIAPYPLD
ncbi:transcriptional regulator [Novosphingobium marinum]|uniref:ADP/GDP-polyphosphate phosphotransferase n=2 Tax=Novosphingobium marinum TaxID=1514948 RepID=A0A7Y9XZK0_9SPHN|nr:polyphosphate kinase 2 [Novosphingobium marinum]NYH96188.1 polyphosphate kinase 2 [Novosphingobium marinum]GGC33185.1 transcriptional regulator [Novosphingobium marinum]